VDLKTFDQQAIYPGSWQRNGYGVDYVVSNYRDLRDLVARTAQQGRGLVLYIN
jgi:hypothetical protein